MIRRFSLAVLLAAVLATVGLFACKPPVPEEPGVVARVDDKPIYLYEVETRHDLLHQFGLQSVPPSLQTIRDEYGTILMGLVVEKLMEEELERQDQAVTPEELEQAEAAVRADYADGPEGTFEEVLMEESIDLDAWRRQLAARLAYQKFSDLVLRPRISLTAADVEAYYRSHIAEFHLPPRYVFVSVQAPSHEMLKKAMDQLAAGRSPQELEQTFRGLRAARLTMRTDRMPTAWREILDKLGPGQVSPVIEAEGGFQQLMLTQRLPDQMLEPSQAYVLVERALLEQKQAAAFAEWLGQAVQNAEIEISAHVLEDVETSDFGEVDAAGEAALMHELPGAPGSEGAVLEQGAESSDGVLDVAPPGEYGDEHDDEPADEPGHEQGEEGGMDTGSQPAAPAPAPGAGG